MPAESANVLAEFRRLERGSMWIAGDALRELQRWKPK